LLNLGYHINAHLLWSDIMFGLKTSSSNKGEMRHLLQQVQDLFNEASSASGDKAEELRKNGLTLLNTAAQKAQDIQHAALDASKDAVKSADNLVHENPWKSVVVSGGIGLLLGVLIGRQ
jgi:ElaB/YqjD/DUF883 family membrane-anchored ribosome-binding protein